MSIKVHFTEYNIKKGHPHDIGYDIASTEQVVLEPGESRWIHTGVRLEMEYPYYCNVRCRSGYAKKNVYCFHGLVDPNYRGEVLVHMHNFSQEPYEIQKGEYIAQLEFQKTIEFQLVSVDQVNQATDRGTSGFGSTDAVVAYND